MENAICVIPWALGEAEYVEQTQVLPGARLGRWLGGMGDGGLGTGEEEPLAGLPAFLLMSH